MDVLQDEYEALRSLFCLPGEFDLLGCDITLNLVFKVDSQPDEVKVKVVIQPKADYPNSVPQLSLFSEQLSRETVAGVKQKASDYCCKLVGEAMIVSLASYLQECLQQAVDTGQSLKPSNSSENKCVSADESPECTCVLQIDHMRSRTKYCKTLEKWSSELTLNGRIVFCNKLILVILQGDANLIKNFIVRLKTVSVDVDSRGHSCKEKMMKIVCEEKHDDISTAALTRFAEFTITEVSNMEEVCDLFTKAGLGDIYHRYIVPIHS